jgi:hypothetical protein
MTSSCKVHPEKQNDRDDATLNSLDTDSKRTEDCIDTSQMSRLSSAELVAVSHEAVATASAYAPHIENGNDIPGKKSNDGSDDHRAESSLSINPDGEKHGLQAAFSEADWRTPSAEIHEDFYIKFLRNFYFPFYVKFHVHICCAWLVVFIICVVFGPAFLSSTRSNLDLPAGTPSAAAVKAFRDNYPSASRLSSPAPPCGNVLPCNILPIRLLRTRNGLISCLHPCC